jgi:hypothetical protein
MADVNLTLNELEELFYDLTVSMIGGTNTADVRRSWPIMGAPAFDINDDVTFIQVHDVSSSMSTIREDKFSMEGSPEDGSLETSYTRTLQINWIFYGPNSWDSAMAVRNKVFFQEFRNTLSDNNIYVIPDFDPPRRIPELFQGLWYQRMDLTMKFNELVRFDHAIHNIESVEIKLYDRKGLRVDSFIEESNILVGTEN